MSQKNSMIKIAEILTVLEWIEIFYVKGMGVKVFLMHQINAASSFHTTLK